MHRVIGLIRTIFCAMLLSFGAAAAASPTEGYAYYSVGDVAAPTKGKTELGLLLMGGGGWDDNAFRWFLEKAANGHIVVLSASAGPDTGESIYNDGGAASVETLVFTDRKAASDPKVLEVLARADGIFIGGGDQSNYVRYWKGTPVERALNAHVARGRPIGGTSAGLAILGATSYGAMDGGSVDSATALADPGGPAVTIVRNFLTMPHLRHVITDSHFAARDRMGRLIAFVAQTRAAGDPKAVGIGIDEKSALCIDAHGIGRLFTSGKDHAWLVEPRGTAKLLKGRPLDYPNVQVTGIGPESRIDLKTMRVTNPAFVGTATVAAGRLTGVPAAPGTP